jgi:hypothetical protein
MSEHSLSLSENVYSALLAAAHSSGMTPTDWIAAHLPENSLVGFERGTELAGAIDSRTGSAMSERLFYETATPQERAQAFSDWAASHGCGAPLLSDYAVSRESFYDDGRS